MLKVDGDRWFYIGCVLRDINRVSEHQKPEQIVDGVNLTVVKNLLETMLAHCDAIGALPLSRKYAARFLESLNDNPERAYKFYGERAHTLEERVHDELESLSFFTFRPSGRSI